MFGNRVPDMEEAEAIDNCVAGLSKIAPLAAEHGVTVCVELLNSKVNHKGYQGDHTAFGVAVMKGVNSPNVKPCFTTSTSHADHGGRRDPAPSATMHNGSGIFIPAGYRAGMR